MKNPLVEVQRFGQSIWLDYLHRDLFTSGELSRLITRDGLRGMTSNPAIFQKAIGESSAYDEEIATLARQGVHTEEIYRHLVVADVRRAADLFRPLYDSSAGRHGFVSLEVNPHLAHDTEATIAEARMYWKLLDRPNVFIKVPATIAGLTAIEHLIAEGINVNVTLLFGLPRYRQVAAAYLAGLAARAARGLPLEQVNSVASFFLSRIDVMVDDILEWKMKAGGAEGKIAAELRGEVAIASARSAYRIYREIYGDRTFTALAAKGARPQRLLWASTGTKNPDYSDIKYVESLIGPETVNTMPRETLEAYRDHGEPQARLEQDAGWSSLVLTELDGLGVDLDLVTEKLEEEGVEKFNRPFDRLILEIEQRRERFRFRQPLGEVAESGVRNREQPTV